MAVVLSIQWQTTMLSRSVFGPCIMYAC
uniref:Uncharacterized protein n=1 Tax=Arundo donax TaxID=35708 RepID=A0A0A9GPU2_ARUDO